MIGNRRLKSLLQMQGAGIDCAGAGQIGLKSGILDCRGNSQLYDMSLKCSHNARSSDQPSPSRPVWVIAGQGSLWQMQSNRRGMLLRLGPRTGFVSTPSKAVLALVPAIFRHSIRRPLPSPHPTGQRARSLCEPADVFPSLSSTLGGLTAHHSCALAANCAISTALCKPSLAINF